MSKMTVEELFNYVLKDAAQRKKQLYSDVSNSLLPASAKNSLLLANNNEVFEDNPDTDLDHLDVILGEPEYDDTLDDDELMKQDTEYTADAIDEQIADEALADKLKNNVKQDNTFFGLNSTINAASKKTRKQQIQEAFNNRQKVTLDTIINRLFNKTDLSDNDKKEALLRILYNNAITPVGSEPADLKLSQRSLRNELEDAGTYDILNELEDGHNFLNKQNVSTDQVPITYMSDKTFDRTGKEHSVFTPTKQTNTLYDKFASKFLDDIAAGNIQDVYNLAPYVMNIYSDTLRTMPYEDWLKVVDEEAKKINAAKEKALGRPLSESEKVELDVPEDALTPEDWAEFMPINIKIGKAAAEKAENKLNRQHGENKEAYKEYLAAVAGLQDPNSAEYITYDIIHGHTPEQELERIRTDVVLPYCRYKIKQLQDEVEAHEALGHDRIVEKLVNLQKYYRNVLDLTDLGIRELNNMAHRYFSKKLRSEYGIPDQKPFVSRNKIVSDEMRKIRKELESDPSTPQWMLDMYANVDKAKAHAKKVANKQYNALPDSLRSQLKSFTTDNLNYDTISSIENYEEKPKKRQTIEEE